MHGWIVAGYPDSLAPGQGYVDRSTDGGIIWDSLYRSTGYEDFFDIRFLDNSLGILVGGDESSYSPIIWRSTNGGANWSSVGAPANAYYLRALDFSGDHGWAVGRFGSVIRTLDAGATWSFQSNPATTTLFDVDFSDTLHGIACGQNIILYTNDGGQTWNQSAVEENGPLSSPRSPILYAYPNPARSRIELQLDPSRVQRAKCKGIMIYDISGRLTRILSLPSVPSHGRESSPMNGGTLCPMPHAVVWDLKDRYGRAVPSGVYFIHLATEGAGSIEKVVILE
jgi:photosystem II stability/assembly factor-like uncharacterized protein